MKRFTIAALLLLAAVSTAGGQVTDQTPGWFIFDMPGMAAPSGGAVDMSPLSSEPAGAHGFVRVGDGHFVDGRGARLRLYGTNVSGNSCYPPEDQIPRIAERLAQLGFNCLRLHFFDSTSSFGIWEDPEKGTLSEEKLRRLDTMIAECARRGVYTNINIHVARQYPGYKDLPKSRTFRLGKSLDRWYPPYVDLLEEYARTLFTRVNTRTGHKYLADPAIACIEINNENTIIADLREDYLKLPEPFAGAFRNAWTAWLKRKYATTSALRKAWGVDVVPLGDEILTKPGNWKIQNAGGAESTLERQGDRDLVWRATRTGTASWHIQLQYKSLPVQAGRYTLSFRIRGEGLNRIHITTMLDRAPWGRLGKTHYVPVSSEWHDVAVVEELKASPDGGPVRLNVSLSNHTGTVELADLSMRPGGGLGLPEGEGLETSIGIPPRNAGVPALNDFFAFLIDTETGTTRRIVRFLKDELGCRAPIADTQANYGGLAGALREATACDYIDIHSYWQHPRYTRNAKGWVTDFYIPNTTQVADAGGGCLNYIARFRVAGMPFSVSEYNTPSPNDHGAETLPLWAFMGAWQDWDALWAYTYRDIRGDFADTSLRKYFHLIGRANLLVHAPASALLFRRSLVVPAPDTMRTIVSPQAVPDLFRRFGRDVGGFWTKLGVDPAVAWNRRVTLEFAAIDGDARFENREGDAPSAVHVERHSDDPEGAWFSLEAPAVRLLVGHVGGRAFEVGDMAFEIAPRPWPRDLPAYACISAVALDEQPLSRSKRILLAASARTENQNMKWNADRTSLNAKGWGSGPTVSEMVPLRARFPGAPVRARALDALGQPGALMPVENGWLQFGPKPQTLWAIVERE